MLSFYRRRKPLIIQHLSSRLLHLSAGNNKTTSCSFALSVFSPINVPSKSNSNPSALFCPRLCYHHENPKPQSTEDASIRHQLFDKLKKSFYELVLNKDNTVPYTNRTRFILFPIKLHSAIGVLLYESRVNMVKEFDSLPRDMAIYVPKLYTEAFTKIRRICPVLPETDPQSVRLRCILKHITDALYKDLKKNGVEAMHLEGLKWEIFVITGPPPAVCVSGGKILISSYFLRDFVTDAEVASVIGHEVAHMVAGHSAEQFTTVSLVKLLLLFPRLIFTYLIPIHSIAEKIQDLPYRSMRMHEAEADYIGMMLIALAGYDPRIAPFVCAKIGKLYAPKDRVSRTHPSGIERAKMLAQVMEEALAKYEEAKALAKVEDEISHCN